MLLAHIAGVPVQESLAYVLPVVVVVGFIYWSGFRERRRVERERPDPAGEPSGAEDRPPSVRSPARSLQRLP